MSSAAALLAVQNYRTLLVARRAVRVSEQRLLASVEALSPEDKQEYLRLSRAVTDQEARAESWR